MEYQELITSAFTSLRANLMRTCLTMLGIIIGISSVILIVSIGQGAEKYITKELSALGTNTFAVLPGNNPFTSFAGGKKSLSIEDANAIREDPSLNNVKNVAPAVVASVTVSANDTNKSLLVQGTTFDAAEIIKPEMIYGEFISEENNLNYERVAVVGVEAAKEFFGEETNPVGEKIKVDNKTFRVVGVVTSPSALTGGVLDNAIFIPVSVALNDIENVEVQRINVSVVNQEILNQTVEDVTQLMRDRHRIEPGQEDDFTIQSSQDTLSTVETITNLLTLMIAAISGISLIVGGVGVMNIMLVSVTERTKEIGLLKAIGALERDILMQFLIESVVMTLIGGLIGIIVGILGAFIISLAASIPFVVSFPAIAAAVGVSMAVGIIFGLYPARRAARLSPIDALRYE